MKKRVLSVFLAGILPILLAGCGRDGSGEKQTGENPQTEIQVFIAASLNTVMEDLAERYQETSPEVKITLNADSSGTLLTQIQEGYECDIFFSAAQKQMDDLEADGLVKDGTRANVVNNQVVVVTLKDSGTKVTGLETLKDAESIALRARDRAKNVQDTGVFVQKCAIFCRRGGSKSFFGQYIHSHGQSLLRLPIAKSGIFV